MRHPNPTSIAHRLLNAGIGSISAEAAKKISQRIVGSRPTLVTILQTVLNAAAAHEIRIVDVGGHTILESRTEANTPPSPPPDAPDATCPWPFCPKHTPPSSAPDPKKFVKTHPYRSEA